MTVAWPLFSTTPIFNNCALRFPPSGTIGEIEIPLHLTKYSPPNPTPSIVEVSYGGVIDITSNLGSGGMTLFQGSTAIDTLQIEGWTDTPFVTSGTGASEVALPGLIIDGLRVTYGEIIAAYFEGRTSLNNAGQQVLTRPRWFRDPFGRVYSTCQIFDLTLQRVEQVPFRNNFTMSLMVF